MQEMKVVRMLYAEARGNVLDGRYPCETEDCIVLGAIQARLELGPYDPAKHTLEFFRQVQRSRPSLIVLRISHARPAKGRRATRLEDFAPN